MKPMCAHLHWSKLIIGRVIIEKVGPNERLKEKLQPEARQVEIGRKKIMETIF
jgi:hypothetical protein